MNEMDRYVEYFELSDLIEELEEVDRWLFSKYGDKIMCDPSYQEWDFIGFCRVAAYRKLSALKIEIKQAAQ